MKNIRIFYLIIFFFFFFVVKFSAYLTRHVFVMKTCVTSKDSDQPVRKGSNCADGQADLLFPKAIFLTFIYALRGSCKKFCH